MDIDYASGRITYDGADRIIAFIEDHGLTLEWLIETHVHADHLSAAPYIQGKLGGKLGIGENITIVQETFGKIFNEGSVFLRDGSQFDRLFKDGDSYRIGGMTAHAIHTPGHTPACMTHVVGDAAFVGDTLFMPDGGSARADFPGGDARTLYRSIQRVLALPRETRLFMCHDYGPNGRDIAWETTVGERSTTTSMSAMAPARTSPCACASPRQPLEMPRLIIPSLQVNMRPATPAQGRAARSSQGAGQRTLIMFFLLRRGPPRCTPARSTTALRCRPDHAGEVRSPTPVSTPSSAQGPTTRKRPAELAEIARRRGGGPEGDPHPRLGRVREATSSASTRPGGPAEACVAYCRLPGRQPHRRLPRRDAAGAGGRARIDPDVAEGHIPILDWGRRYSRATLTSDVLAAIIVTIMLIPQSLAYALLAGLPPEVGHYASILPMIAYAIFGTSTALAVGPVAVVSLMTATAIGRLAATGTVDYASAAIVLAALSGAMLVVMGLLRLGFIANFLSHPVISASSRPRASSSRRARSAASPASNRGPRDAGPRRPIVANIGTANAYTMAVGGGALRPPLRSAAISRRPPAARRAGRRRRHRGAAGPVVVVFPTMAASGRLQPGARRRWSARCRRALPMLSLPSFSLATVQALVPALIISVVGFVESISVPRRSPPSAASASTRPGAGRPAPRTLPPVGGGYPVTGGFARSVVNYDAGAATRAAGAFTALGIAARPCC
jgi:glyoxylase-like metal-dependent hydrolase (beta-lactamase superfamily II)